MFLAQQLEEVREKGQLTGWRLIRYSVELVNSKPVWKFKESRGDWSRWHYPTIKLARREARKYSRKEIPFIATIGPNKAVSMREAEMLTGIRAPAALDALTDRLVANDFPDTLENYVKPKPVKEPKPEPVGPVPPTPAEAANANARKAQLRVEKWERAAEHAAKKIRQWTKKASYYRKRAARLSQQTAGGAA